MNKTAIIQVGNVRNLNNNQKIHCYWFPNDITEIELQEEINFLENYYTNIILQLPIPQHIRSKNILNCNQCTMFCEFYKRGCTKNVNE